MMNLDTSKQSPALIIPSPEFKTLRLFASGKRRDGIEAATASWLAFELARAEIVSPHAVPKHVVTMHSRLEYLDEVTASIKCLTLVYPGEQHWDAQCISVLDPLGTAVLGLSEGQSIEWNDPLGCLRGITVLRILFQPYNAASEAAFRGH